MQTVNLESKLIVHLNNATKSELNNGLSWYKRANSDAKAISLKYNLNLAAIIGTISALSPMNKWDNNIKDAIKLIQHPSINTKVSTFKSNRIKALKILSLSDTSDDNIMKILNGNKTKAFYHNIRYPNSSNMVTIDRWAFKSLELKPSDKNYRVASEAYAKLANDLNIIPNKLQAIIWLKIRNEN